jgi:hypothetical protein
MAAGEISPSILSFKFRLLPTQRLHAQLAAILETQRRLYNDALAERIDAYRRSVLEVERGRRAKPQTITFFDQTNSLTAIRNDPLTRDEFTQLPALLQHWTPEVQRLWRSSAQDPGSADASLPALRTDPRPRRERGE